MVTPVEPLHPETLLTPIEEIDCPCHGQDQIRNPSGLVGSAASQLESIFDKGTKPTKLNIAHGFVNTWRAIPSHRVDLVLMSRPGTGSSFHLDLTRGFRN